MTSKALRSNKLVPRQNPNRISTLVRFAAASALLTGAILGITGCGNNTLANTAIKPSALTSNGKHRTLILVWDGMRPDSIDANLTPTLYGLVKAGSYFSDNHSTYPTYTMANGAAFATGGFIGTTGFNGNNTYAGPSTGLVSASGNSSAGVKVDFTQPQFTEDWGILDDLNAYYENNYKQTLLTVGTLFQAAQGAGLKTAAVGKSGPAYLQDFLKGGIIADENVVFPLSFAKELQNQQVVLPANTVFGYPTGTITLSATNGTPTLSGSKVNLADGITPDPTSNAGSRQSAANAYLTSIFAGPILQNHTPDLAVFWLRNPDATEHDYGPGTVNHNAALKAQDDALAQIVFNLKALGIYQTTNIIVVSDHAHSSVSGPQTIFPLRTVVASATAGVNTLGTPSTSGYSVSGYVRGADMLTRQGFHAYDGNPCVYEPVLNGINAAGKAVYPTLTDTTGSICGTAGTKYTTPAYKVPATMPSDAVILVTPGGSEMYFVPSHNPVIVQKLVTYLQSRQEYGPIFVDKQYGSLPGTFNASAAKLQNPSARNPDVIASMNYDETQSVAGKIGTTFNNSANNRGMHGSFSPVDVHNTLVAEGPDFKAGFTDTLPTGNVDVAPTVAYLLGLALPQADGRPLLEALTSGGSSSYSVTSNVTSTATVQGVAFQSLLDPTGNTLDSTLKGNYTSTMFTKLLTDPNGKVYTYFDSVKAIRQ